MKVQFKIQQFQLDAVDAVVQVFQGHSRQTGEAGGGNGEVELTDAQLLDNIRRVQSQHNLPLSTALAPALGRCGLDVEMETGTGKTYVYIKTIFELNRRYGWSKFIVVVPSIAIREGVYQTFRMTAQHFMEHFGKKARFFLYDSSNLDQLDHFSSGGGIQVMIINTQAFASSLKEDGKSKEARIIYSQRDAFGSRRPIDVIGDNRPILILDEPQKMGGAVTQQALERFCPLFSLYYSATHAVSHNRVYVLDALDAFQKRLVKKIEVKGFEIQRGGADYLFLEEIRHAPRRPPRARVELEVESGKAARRETREVGVGDDLYTLSGNREGYRGYTVSEIDPLEGAVRFANGRTLHTGQVWGEVSQSDLRRIQIRETILSHFEKEEKLFSLGIKTLSLFFIDQVAKYRQYDPLGREVLGEYGQIFEEEYQGVLQSYLTGADTPYQTYLRTTCSQVGAAHRGYFSIDPKTGRSVDSRLKRGSSLSDDISAYDLILRHKERLLSLAEPTRFLFSHSALREGWDNPNVFQICTLKQADSQTTKRQEVGRGLRLCVDQEGRRMDGERCGAQVHEINVLTVIASESYQGFVAELQSDLKKELRHRAAAATRAWFEGKYVQVDGAFVRLDRRAAQDIETYLTDHGYVDAQRRLTPRYHTQAEQGETAPLPPSLAPMEEGVHALIRSLYDDSAVEGLVTDGHRTKVWDNPLNQNFDRAEFQALWQQLNRRYAYTVALDSQALIARSISKLRRHLWVDQAAYTTTVGRQRADMSWEETRAQAVRPAHTGPIKYDLVGRVAQGTMLTRKTVAAILKGMPQEKLELFQRNPEGFIARVVELIGEEKGQMAAQQITYVQLEGGWDSEIFSPKTSGYALAQGIPTPKGVQDYVFWEECGAEGGVRRLVAALEGAPQVCVYAKLPRGFHIPTPMGDYTPGWAIVLQERTGPRFVVADLGGTARLHHPGAADQIQQVCAGKLFGQLFHGRVEYHAADRVDTLLDVLGVQEESR